MRHPFLCWLFPALLGALASTAPAEHIVFPPDAGAVNVRDFGAKGDGTADDTTAIQRAIDKVKGIPDTLYFPDGTYLVSDSVGIFDGRAHSRDRFLTYQGQNESGTIIKLKDNCPGFGDPDHPKIVLSVYEGQSTGDCMHGYVRNLTVDAGRGNPGAVGLRFMSNNTGAVHRVTIRSSDPNGAGKLGLDMRQSQNGPSLVRHVTVIGFDTGVETANSFSLVFEHLALRGQNVVGFHNHHARTTLRGLKSDNRVPALRNTGHGQMTLVEAELFGGVESSAAIVSENARMFLRDIRQSGYGHVLVDASGRHYPGAAMDEWFEGKPHSLFGDEPQTLRLPIEETPEVPWETDLSKWAKVDWSEGDASVAVQRAIDEAAREGKTTLYFPRRAGTRQYPTLRTPIRVHGSIHRIVGMSNIVNVHDATGRMPGGEAVFTFEDLAADTVVVERFFKLGGWKPQPADVVIFENKSESTVVLRNLDATGVLKKPDPGGRWFLEDVAPSRIATLRIGPREQVWVRQFNPESPETDMIAVDGGQLWMLGLKTEGRARHVLAENGARVEVLGGVSYQSWGHQPIDPPMFTVIDSDASFTIGFYHWNQPFTTIVEERRGGETRMLLRKELAQYHLPLYRASGDAGPESLNERRRTAGSAPIR